MASCNSVSSVHGAAVLLILKASGIRLDREGNRFVQDYFATFTGSLEDARKLSKCIVDFLTGNNKHRQSVSKAILQDALSVIQQQQLGTDNVHLIVINPFSMAYYSYNRDKRRIIPSTFEKENSVGSISDGFMESLPTMPSAVPQFSPMYMDALSKPRVFEIRHNLVYLKLSHYYKMRTRNAVAILTVDDLRTAARDQSMVVFGMLVSRERKFFLEDPSAIVELLGLTDDKLCQHRKGIYYDGCFVLVEGVKRDSDNLAVANICLPPVESAETLRSYFGNTDFFLGQLKDSQQTPKTNRRLLQIECEYQSQMMLVLNDVMLDDAKCMNRLHKLLQTYLGGEPLPASLPFCIIFMGQFHQHQQLGYASGTYTSSVTQLKRGFAQLGAVVAPYSNVIVNNKVKLIFVPGLDEIGISNVLPRPPLPRVLLEIFAAQAKLPLPAIGSSVNDPDVVLVNACNPCRLRYLTQDIVIVADRLLTKMCRNAVRMPPRDEDLGVDFARTLLSQSHLAPFMPHVTTTYWAYDHTLSMITSPDAIIFGDEFKPFETQHQQCLVANVGVFGQPKKAQYMRFYPIKKVIHLIETDDDAVAELAGDEENGRLAAWVADEAAAVLLEQQRPVRKRAKKQQQQPKGKQSDMLASLMSGRPVDPMRVVPSASDNAEIVDGVDAPASDDDADGCDDFVDDVEIVMEDDSVAIKMLSDVVAVEPHQNVLEVDAVKKHVKKNALLDLYGADDDEVLID